MSVSDTHGQFVTLLGQSWEGVRLTGPALEMTIIMQSGRELTGTPTVNAAAPSGASDEFDESGVLRALSLDGELIDVADVRRFSVGLAAGRL